MHGCSSLRVFHAETLGGSQLSLALLAKLSDVRFLAAPCRPLKLALRSSARTILARQLLAVGRAGISFAKGVAPKIAGLGWVLNKSEVCHSTNRRL